MPFLRCLLAFCQNFTGFQYVAHESLKGSLSEEVKINFRVENVERYLDIFRKDWIIFYQNIYFEGELYQSP